MTNRRVLLVDDEPHVLEAIERKLGADFEITTAVSGASALELLTAAADPFAVIVSDMRMPNMDGAAFLAQARGLAKTSIRLLLTGETSLKSAIEAVNQGHIFRFLCKPCAPEVLRAALEAAIEQHRLVTAERDIMERTLSAVVQTLTDVLALSEPTLFERATVVKSYVSHVARQLGLEGAWQIGVAASLHALGLIALPADLVQRDPNSPAQTAEQRKQLASHPETARRLLAAIPRLEDVALIVAQQAVEPTLGPPWVQRGARLLRLALRVESRVARGTTLAAALDALHAPSSEDERTFLNALSTLQLDAERMECQDLRVRQLAPAMILESDVHTLDGSLVLTKGRTLSAVLIERLLQFAGSRGLVEPIRVRVPGRAN